MAAPPKHLPVLTNRCILSRYPLEKSLHSPAMVPEATLVWIQLGVELPFVLFHVTVLICVLRSVHQRQPYFATAFFRIYALQSAVELWSYASVKTSTKGLGRDGAGTFP